MSPARRDLLKQAIAEGRDWYYGDHGYFKRFHYYRVAKNRFQRQYRDADLSSNRDRFKLSPIELKPWQEGSTIVVCPNSPVYMSWFGIDAQQWVLDVVKRLGELTDRPIVVRWKASASMRPLYYDLHQAHLVVVFSSAAAVEALAHGVPICTLAPWATTAPMGITSLDKVNDLIIPPIEKRDRFMFTLANHQWTLDEIEAGAAWKAVAHE